MHHNIPALQVATVWVAMASKKHLATKISANVQRQV